MTRKSQLLGLAAMLCAFLTPSMVSAQVSPTDKEVVRSGDQERHEEWQEGKSSFPGRPKDMWQVGINGGSFLVTGDVKPQLGFGFGVHARKSLGYVLSLRADLMYGQAKGLNYQATSAGSHPNVYPFPTTVVSNGQLITQTPGLYGTADAWYASYKTSYYSGAIQAVFNLNNIKFHRKENKWALNLVTGLGLNAYNTKYDALDGNGQPYDYSSVPYTGDDLNSVSNRKEVRKEVKNIHDGDYETNAQRNSRNIMTLGDTEDPEASVLSVNPFVQVGLGVEFLITDRISLGLEHLVVLSADDYIDGKSRKENGSLTSNIDVPQYTNVRVNFHLGNKNKRIRPLWFVNPMQYPMKDIEDVKDELNNDLFADSDEDGVPDKLDQEPNTPKDTEVDTKGRALDSDKDGIPNSKDKEPFSPAGYETNDEGVAQIPTEEQPLTRQDMPELDKRYLTEDDLERLRGEGKLGGDWYLPMIHFKLNRYEILPEAVEQLHHVASIMKAYPELNVVAHGHTDTRAADKYNDMLSYNRAMAAVNYLAENYGIDKSRFIIKYNGEESELIKKATREAQHKMNRRVEFYVDKDGAKSQARPSDVRGNWKY